MSIQIEENYETTNEIIETTVKGVKYGVRHLQVIMMFAMLALNYAHRSILSVAVVAMVDASSDFRFQKFNWDSGQQSYLLSSFYWGYIVTQIPSGPLAQRYGVKMIALISTVTSSILTLLTPFCASIGGWKTVCVTRFVMGLMQGFIYSCFGIFATKWAPPSERGKMLSFGYSGLLIGIIASMSIGGIIADSIGWPFIFYISGAAGLVWSIFWFCFGGETPNDIKYISTEEANYINDSCGLNLKIISGLAVPWKQILSSVPLISLTLAHFCNNFGFIFLLTNIPTYIKYVLNFDITNNGFISALPYAAQFIFALFFGFLSDLLINNNYAKVTTSRKIFCTIMLWGAMVVLLGIAFVSEKQITIAILLLLLGVSFTGAAPVSIHVNQMDLSPNFTGVLMGLTNFLSTIAAIISPLAAGIIIQDKADSGHWQIMFFITSGLYFIGNLVFLIFGTAVVQPWNNPQIISLSNQEAAL